MKYLDEYGTIKHDEKSIQVWNQFKATLEPIRKLAEHQGLVSKQFTMSTLGFNANDVNQSEEKGTAVKDQIILGNWYTVKATGITGECIEIKKERIGLGAMRATIANLRFPNGTTSEFYAAELVAVQTETEAEQVKTQKTTKLLADAFERLWDTANACGITNNDMSLERVEQIITSLALWQDSKTHEQVLAEHKQKAEEAFAVAVSVLDGISFDSSKRNRFNIQLQDKGNKYYLDRVAYDGNGNKIGTFLESEHV